MEIFPTIFCCITNERDHCIELNAVESRNKKN
uniref:Uncharacterized protein n=1 Tax=Arundo donax TaxID=35708 RepID=A0A0A9HTG1_ARUDO